MAQNQSLAMAGYTQQEDTWASSSKGLEEMILQQTIGQRWLLSIDVNMYKWIENEIKTVPAEVSRHERP